jgi:hypothetical protein
MAGGIRWDAFEAANLSIFNVFIVLRIRQALEGGGAGGVQIEV